MVKGLVKALLFHDYNTSDKYVMDLSTGKSNHFINGQENQWIM